MYHYDEKMSVGTFPHRSKNKQEASQQLSLIERCLAKYFHKKDKRTTEELASYNAELRAIIEEYETANELLRVRTSELERLDRFNDEFLALAGHELRTPLTSILGYAELLESSMKPQAVGGQYEIYMSVAQREIAIGQIVRQANRMAQMINEILDVACLRHDKFELALKKSIDIVALVRRVVEQQARTASHPIEMLISREVIVGTLDEARIEQVLTNLLSNAFKYSSSGKPVVVTLMCRNSNEVVISVRDEGRGIREEEQAYIFDHFYRVRSQVTPEVGGLGLGLYIAREIVLRHGGQMWLESKVGEGSTFYFSLPLE